MKKVLDCGYVSLVEKWGSDEGIIEAARMSTDKGFLGWGPIACPSCVDNGSPAEQCEDKKPGDEKLLRYLWENKHATPFEMAGATFEIKAPIFVFREWHRHRTQSYNEMSARYVPLPDENYVPSIERLMMNSGTSNKQAGAVQGSEALTPGGAEGFQFILKAAYAMAEQDYRQALQRGVPKELARLVLPVGRYSKMRASANLRNWLAFLTFRQDAAAQYEIRQYANAVCEFLSDSFYVPLPDENYVPSIERLMMNSGTSNKQAGAVQGSEALTPGGAEGFQFILKAAYAMAEQDYRQALQRGVPKELARLVLPVGRYSKMRASANLRNWLAFLTLRQDAAAQYEIRQYANAVCEFLSDSFPRTLALFLDDAYARRPLENK